MLLPQLDARVLSLLLWISLRHILQSHIKKRYLESSLCHTDEAHTVVDAARAKSEDDIWDTDRWTTVKKRKKRVRPDRYRGRKGEKKGSATDIRSKKR